MTQEQILDFNKRCATFLWPDAKKEYESGEIEIEDGIFKKAMLIFGHFHLMKFHSDWNWIKSVLEKISSLNEDDFSDETTQAFEDLLDLSLFSSKESVCESINNFIKTIK